MLIKDKTKYCWVNNGKAGEPQDSIKDAIADYLEYISYIDDVTRDRDIEWVRVVDTLIITFQRLIVNEYFGI